MVVLVLSVVGGTDFASVDRGQVVPAFSVNGTNKGDSRVTFCTHNAGSPDEGCILPPSPQPIQRMTHV